MPGSFDPPQAADPRLGRIQNFDDRSWNYPIRTLLPPAVPRSYTWSCKVNLNQGSEGSCVGFSIAHELAARPVVVGTAEATFDLARHIYKEAQKIDPWPGEAYEGTSVLAGIKIATQLGYYHEYRWAFGIKDMVMAVGYRGPAVLGIPWHNGMFSPDAQGVIKPTGGYAGGHAILCNAVRLAWPTSIPTKDRTFENLNMINSMARLHNSWGVSWGLGGECLISLYDLGLLLGQGGEACIPVLRDDPL